MTTAERVIASVATVHEYARDVLSGAIVAGPYVRAACRRHLDDLIHGTERGLFFDEKAAQRALTFVSYLNLEEGTPFVLEPFQTFIVGSLFGWYRDDGHRRFRNAFVEIAKGNGKTPMWAAIGLKGLCADGVKRAEIYSAAPTSFQSRIMYTDAQSIVAATPELASRLESLQTGITYGWSFFRPWSGSGKAGTKKSGFRPHMGLVDELMEHDSSAILEMLVAGTKRDLDALIGSITNSGTSKVSVCWEEHQYSINVVEGIILDDARFVFIACLDEGDDWRDESVWPKANPGLGTILPIEYLRQQVFEAINKPSKENLVKRLHFCIWTEQESRWLEMTLWDDSGRKIAPTRLLGKACYGGLTLVQRRDIAAFVLYFPAERAVLPFFWIPEAMEVRTQKDREVIAGWQSQGLVKFTPGNTTDFDRIHDDIKALAPKYAIEEIAYNQWNATQLANDLAKSGATMVPMQQGGAHMSEAAKALEALVASLALTHFKHAVLRWMASNVAVHLNQQGDIRIDREQSGDNVEGIVALVMAIARAIVPRDEPEEKRPPKLYTRTSLRKAEGK